MGWHKRLKDGIRLFPKPEESQLLLRRLLKDTKPHFGFILSLWKTCSEHPRDRTVATATTVHEFFKMSSMIFIVSVCMHGVYVCVHSFHVLGTQKRHKPEDDFRAKCVS